MADRNETARERFHDLGRKRVSILAELAPVEKKLHDLVAETHPKEKALRDQIKKLRAPLFELDNERAFLSRAVGGQTGRPEDYGEGKKRAE